MPDRTPMPDRTAMPDRTLMADLIARRGVRDFADLHAWSITDPDAFWSLAWDDLGIVGTKGDRIRSGTGLPGTHFFPDARLNVVDTLLAGKSVLKTLGGLATFPGLTPGERWQLTRLIWRILRMDDAAAEAQDGRSVSEFLAAQGEHAVEQRVVGVSLAGLGRNAGPLVHDHDPRRLVQHRGHQSWGCHGSTTPDRVLGRSGRTSSFGHAASMHAPTASCPLPGP